MSTMAAQAPAVIAGGPQRQENATNALARAQQSVSDRALADRDLLDEAEELMVGREGDGGLGERISAAVVWAVMNAKCAFA